MGVSVKGGLCEKGTSVKERDRDAPGTDIW